MSAPNIRRGARLTVVMSGDPVEQFRDALKRRAILPPSEIIADGKLHRCDAEGRNGQGDAAYVLHLDGLSAGGFENWRDGLGWENWRADLDRPYTIAEQAAHQAQIEATRHGREAEEERRRGEARGRATAIWKVARTAPAEAVRGEFVIRPLLSASEINLGNAGATYIDRGRRGHRVPRRRVAQALCHRASGGRGQRCNNP